MARSVFLALSTAATLVAVAAAEADTAGLQHRFAAGVAVVDFDYEEADEGSTLNHEHGTLPGLFLEWRSQSPHYFIETSLFFLKGDVNYDGRTQAGASVRSTTDEVIWRGEITAGWRHSPHQHVEYQALAGLGYRDWQRDIQPTPDANGLEETYTFWYGRVGLRTFYRPNTKHRWSLELSAKRPIAPEVYVQFENALDAVTLDLGEATTVDVALTWQYELWPTVDLEAELSHRAWELGRSANRQLTQNGTPVGTLFEPESETSTTGLVIRLAKTF